MKSDLFAKNVKYILLWIFVIFLSVSFIAFFTFEGGSITPPQQNIVGTVDTHKIINSRGSVFQSFYSRIYNYYNQYSEGGISSTLNETITRTAFDETVNQFLLLKEADKAHIYIEENELIRGIRNIYGEENFRAIVSSTDPALKKQIETNAHYSLRAEKVRGTLFYHVPVTTQEEKLYTEVANIKKQAFIATLDLSEQVLEQADNEENLFEYFEANQERYQDLTAETPEVIDNIEETDVTSEDATLSENSLESATPSDLENSSPVVETPEAPEALRLIFEANLDTIKEDFLIENSKTLADEFRVEILAKLKSLIEEVQASSAPRNVFDNGVNALGMKLQVTDYFSYFEKEIPVDTEVSETETLTLPEAFHREIFTAPDSETAFGYGEENDTTVYGVLILDTLNENQTSSEDSSETSDSFVAQRYKEQLNNDTRSRFINNYFTYLHSFSEIFYQDVRQ